MRSSALFLFTGLCLAILVSTECYSQNVGIGTNTPDASALLDIKSNNKGILVPRTSTTSLLLIVNPAKGLMLYDTTTSSFWFYNAVAWKEVPSTNNVWNITGNSGTDSALNFIGTTDDKPFHFRLNNLWAGEMHPTNGNIFLGMGAGQANTTAGKNTAIGTGALQNQSFNYDGETNNVAIGFEALTLNNPTSTGYGISNTAIGSFALRNNTTGHDNTAVGTSALYFNQTGITNTAIGRQALFSNTDGNGNTAAGFKALRFNIHSFNTAFGYEALSSNTIGVLNTAIGTSALNSNTDGYDNTAVGAGANNDLSSSVYNTLIGSGAHCSSSSSVVIGVNSFTNVDNLALLGNPFTSYIGGYSNWSNFSDGRFKKDINENVRGLDFIMRLRPVTYHMDVRGLYNFWGINPYGTENSTINAKSRYFIDDAITKKEAVRMTGFVAQEVEKAAISSNYDFDGVMSPTHDKDHYRIAYGEFVVPIVKAVQEQQSIIEEQNKKIELLLNEMQQVKEQLSKVIDKSK